MSLIIKVPKLLRARGEYAGGRETSGGDYGIDDAETVNGEKICVDESNKPKPMTATCPPGETSAALIRGGRRGAARPFDGLLNVGIARGGGGGEMMGKCACVQLLDAADACDDDEERRAARTADDWQLPGLRVSTDAAVCVPSAP